MAWLDELQVEMRRRQASEPQEPQLQTEDATDEDVAQAQALIRRLLEQMNQQLLEGRGSIWETTQLRWGMRLWELWWGPTQTEGQHFVVTLLRDSRGTPYLKVQRRRLAVQDPKLERQLQRALRAAFLQPNVYITRDQAPSGP